jgi:hypothetical protein
MMAVGRRRHRDNRDKQVQCAKYPEGQGISLELSRPHKQLLNDGTSDQPVPSKCALLGGSRGTFQNPPIERRRRWVQHLAGLNNARIATDEDVALGRAAAPLIDPATKLARVDTEMGTLVVRRPKSGWRDFARSYRIKVDGRPRGRVRRGQSLELSVTAGRHVVCARIDWKGSPELLIDVEAGTSVTCCVEPNGSAWIAAFQLAGREPWLRLYTLV